MVLFSKDEEEVVANFFLQNREVIQATGRSADANIKRNQLYKTLLDTLNSENPDIPKTLQQVKDKIQYLLSKAKSKNSVLKKSRNTTGGGRLVKSPKLTATDEKFINVFGSTASFSGISVGMESLGSGLTTFNYEDVKDIFVCEASAKLGDDIYSSQHQYQTQESDDLKCVQQTNRKRKTFDLPPMELPSDVPKLEMGRKKNKTTDLQQLQMEVLRAQLEAARSTVELNKKMEQCLQKVEAIVEAVTLQIVIVPKEPQFEE